MSGREPSARASRPGRPARRARRRPWVVARGRRLPLSRPRVCRVVGLGAPRGDREPHRCGRHPRGPGRVDGRADRAAHAHGPGLHDRARDRAAARSSPPVSSTAPRSSPPGAKTIPSIWPAAAIVGWAVLRGWRGGVVAASLVAACSFLEVVEPTANTVTNSILGLLLGGCIGYCVDLTRASHAALAQAMRLEAARAERDRLARTVHDGVLQTLAFINRRAIDIGGETAALGAMAGEQERILRTLVSQADLSEVDRAVSGEADLRGLLAHVETDEIALVAPGRARCCCRAVSPTRSWPPSRRPSTTCASTPARGPAPWVLLDDDGAGCAGHHPRLGRRGRSGPARRGRRPGPARRLVEHPGPARRPRRHGQRQLRASGRHDGRAAGAA